MMADAPLRAQPDSRLLDAEQPSFAFDEPEASDEHHLLDDYRQRYGLSEDPFAQDYSFPLFTAGGRRQLLDQLLHLCQFSNSVLVVAGEQGVGKTRTAHAFMDSLSDQDKICFLSLQPGQTIEQILQAIVQAFGIYTGPSLSADQLLPALERYIAEEAVANDNGLSLVVVDNAHCLDERALTTLLELLNNFPQQQRLHLALFGSPALMGMMKRYAPPSLLVNDFELAPFSLNETVDYLNFRMEMADYLGPEIFTENLVESWWRRAQGELPMIHQFAQQRLLESVSVKAPSVKRQGLPVMHLMAIAGVIAVVGVAIMYMGGSETVEQPQVTSLPVNPALTSTQTPVQPILQTLPTNATPRVGENTAASEVTIHTAPQTPVIQEAPAVVIDEPEGKVVPLAELPTTPARIPEPLPQPVLQSEPTRTVTTEPEIVSTPVATRAPEPKPATVATPAPKAQVTSSAPKPSVTAGSGILSWKATDYTIQLLGVSTQKAAADFIASQPNRADLTMFKTTRQGRDWFVVVAGRYGSAAQARQAITTLPAAQRESGPWPREVGVIQKEIRSAQ